MERKSIEEEDIRILADQIIEHDIAASAADRPLPAISASFVDRDFARG